MRISNGVRIVAAVAVAAGVTYAVIARGKATGLPSTQRGLETRAIPVEVTLAQGRHFEDVVSVQGSLKSRNFALVSPRIQGALAEVFVREGDEVKGGETRLFQTDSLKLEKAVEFARQALNVARCAREEKEAGAEASEAQYRKAESDYSRYRALLEARISSTSEYEDKQSDFDQKSAMRKDAQALVALAKEEERRAQTTLSMAEKDLKDSLVLAPISGRVSRRMAEPGEMGTPGAPVIRIDDVSDLEASAYLPAQYYPGVKPGQTHVRIASESDSARDYVISYKSPTVDGTLRTFEIKCPVAGNADWAVPGALAQMDVILAEKDALGVPGDAVCLRADRKVVFLADGSKARMVTVNTGLETDGWSEIAGSVLPDKSPVITRGQSFLDDGASIAIRQEAR